MGWILVSRYSHHAIDGSQRLPEFHHESEKSKNSSVRRSTGYNGTTPLRPVLPDLQACWRQGLTWKRGRGAPCHLASRR
jgi:hypothetical protein